MNRSFPYRPRLFLRGGNNNEDDDVAMNYLEQVMKISSADGVRRNNQRTVITHIFYSDYNHMIVTTV
jgi:hypothetical protein